VEVEGIIVANERIVKIMFLSNNTIVPVRLLYKK